MTIATTSALIAAAAIATAFVAGQFTKKELYTEVTINAPAEAVWAELTDTASYPTWNPFIKSIEGELQVGDVVSATIQPPEKSSMDFAPVILKLDENEELRWVGRLLMPGIFDGEHYFILEQDEDGNTLFRHGENFSGMLAAVVYMLIEADTRKGFEAMNVALKERVEARS